MAYKNIEDQRAASRRHYRENKQKYFDRNIRYRNELREFVHKLKESQPCMDCGVNYPYYVMDFDHRDGKEKEHEVGRLYATGRAGAFKKEIVKCDLVCSNCHRARTHKRLNYKHP